MTDKNIIKTKRLILRPWREEDLEPFARLNAEPRVMEYFPSNLSREESDQMVRRIQTKVEEKGFCWWAVSVPGVAEFIGFIGLNSIDQSTLPVHFTPAVEIGWRLAHEYWGKGYATEGAIACLQYAFENLHLNEIVSFTAIQNKRSRAVMERIGMHHDPKDDFDHPKLPEEHELRRHVLYRLRKDEWKILMMQSNQKKFSALRKFNLPRNQYVIIGSGPLGIRNLKEIGDIDIIVTPQLWNILAERYGISDHNKAKKIVFPGGVIEAFSEGSFYTSPEDDQAPTMASRIANAEIIEGLPFDSLENVLYYKSRDAREKDLKDILLIEKWLKTNS